MISDYELFMTKYVSVPKDLGTFTPAAFVAGIVKGVLDGAGFPARYALPACPGEQWWAHVVHAWLWWNCCGTDACVAARVSAHFVAVKGQAKPKTTILMKFEASVLQRESRLPNA